MTGEKKQTDAGTNTRIAPKNVVIMRMRFGPLNDSHPGAPRPKLRSSAADSGFESTNGRTIEGTWKRSFLDRQADEVLRRGRERSPLTVGQTFSEHHRATGCRYRSKGSNHASRLRRACPQPASQGGAAPQAEPRLPTVA